MNLDTFIAFLVTFEVFSALLFFYYYFRQHCGFNPALALSFSFPSTIVVYSLLLQCLFLLGIPKWIFAAEVLFAVVAIFKFSELLRLIRADWANLKIPKSAYVWLFLITLPLLYLYFQSLVLLPNNHDSLVYHLARILLFLDAGTLFPSTISDYTQACYPIGHDILYYLFLRFDIGKGTAFFSFFAFSGCILTVYSLVRSRYTRKTAAFSSLIFACLPEMIFLATTPKNDLAVALFALCSLLAFLQFEKISKLKNLGFLLLFLTAGISMKATFLAFAVPFAFILLVWLLRNGLTRSTIDLLINKPRSSTILLIACLILSQVWLFIYNSWSWGTWNGPPFFVNGNINQDGSLGAVANLCRYFFESLHLTQPIEFLIMQTSNFSLQGLIQSIYNTIFLPIFGDVALAQPFVINWSQTEDTWFGPFGFAVAWIGAPAAFFFRKSPVKWIGLLAFIFLILVAYKVKWWNSNQRYLTCFFALAVIASAPLVDCLVNRKLATRFLCLISILIGSHALLFNVTKPFFHFLSVRPDQMLKDSVFNGTNVWSQTKWGEVAWWPHSLGDWKELDLKNKTVGIVASNHHNHLNFIMAHPDTRFVGLAHDRGLPKDSYERIFSNQEINLSGIDFLLLLSVNHSINIGNASDSLTIITPAENTLKKVPFTPKSLSLSLNWQYQHDENKPAYVLYKVVQRSEDS
jgi:4-amino-4-deoxy-L-arabinose transferase-like glycosyltransferase